MTNHRWTRKRSHRSMAMLVTALTLVVGACGSDDDDDASSTTDSAELTSPGTTEPPDTTTRSDTTEPTHVSVAATAAPTREATPAAAAETSAPPTTASGDVEAAADGVVTPIVVCVDVNRGVAYFGYTNSGSATVEIPVGAANRVTLPDDTDVTATQPDVFAPGEQGVVFWAESYDPANPPTWTLSSGDGIERSASADSSATACPDRQPPLDPPDDRTAAVLGTLDTSGASPTITLTVEGIPDESRCPAGTGWAPEPPDVVVDAAGGNATTEPGADPSTAVLTVDDASLAPSTGFDVAGFVSIFVYVDVEDRCTDEAGVTSRAWAASESLRDLSQIGERICFGATDDGYGEVDCSEGPTLAPTGGIRSR